MFRQKFDFYLLLPVVFLLGLSLAAVASVSPPNLGNHLLYLVLGIVFFLFFSFLDLEIILPLSPFFYLFCLCLLTLPFLIGTVTRGSMRWIPLGDFTIQPSEIVKPFLAIFAAWFWAKREFSFKNFLLFFLLFLPVLVLIFFQPDLGSTLVVLSIFSGLVLVSRISLKQLLALVLLTSLTFPLFWFSLRNYQKLRVIHFLNPYLDPLGEGYNLIQSKIAVGSGSLFGRGLGRGTQSHLAFLPERHTDFIFASLAEELGFLGSGLILLLYIFLFLRILKIAAQSRTQALSLLSLALFFYLFFQTAVNIGMNIGLLPITGITLPLISYGGSSLLATAISLGLLESISRSRTDERVIEIK
ncbi:MAG TPA: rod shape-determining protein RodA [Clostridia bacterium]|nr:rod shape-determining protein RodA [Clostridia bacterium]